MLAQIAQLLVDVIASFFVFLLLARFHFQWLRVPFRNPVGAFIVATTDWIVRPARRVIPAAAGLDLATLAAAWLVQALALWLLASMVAVSPALGAIALLALLDLVRYSLYILIFAVIVEVVLSWVNPYSPVAPLFQSITRPFLAPIRRLVPPIANVDLSPLVLLLLLQVVLIPLGYLRALAGAPG
jgi:YggT family protein